MTAQYVAGQTGATTSTIANQIQLVNNGTASVPLSALTVRYWFTEDGAQPLVYACDYAPVGCSNITGTFSAVSQALTGADHYVQLGSASAPDRSAQARAAAPSRAASASRTTPP